jgi:hypothetical protein
MNVEGVAMRNRDAVKVPLYLAIPLMLAYVAAYLVSMETIEIHVEDKSAGRHPRALDEYGGPPLAPGMAFLIYTEGEVFQVGRVVFLLEFQPAERYHQLKVGQRYRVTVAGWRVPELHWYRNIIGIER